MSISCVATGAGFTVTSLCWLLVKKNGNDNKLACISLNYVWTTLIAALLSA